MIEFIIQWGITTILLLLAIITFVGIVVGFGILLFKFPVITLVILGIIALLLLSCAITIDVRNSKLFKP
ncbi:MAG: hypothetical protein PHN69_03110 [Candidatus Pacebacteria bacterium]|nr:hypothetical protein [Candidatus Paceibacterota bacterium]